jgi:WD40 repeat protein
LLRFNLKTEQAQVLGYHEGVAARSCFASTTNSLVTGGWDHTLRVWDPRQSKSQASRHQLSERVYDMDISPSSNLLVVGMAGRLTEIWDVRKMNEPVQKRESSLKFMTRSVACMHNGEGNSTNVNILPHLTCRKATQMDQLKVASLLNTLTRHQRYKKRNTPSSATARRSTARILWHL